MNSGDYSLYSDSTIYQASVGFSTVQGQNGWYYVEKTPAGYVDMVWNTADNLWRGSAQWCVISGQWQHPQTNESARKWVAPKNGDIVLNSNGNIRMWDPAGDGVRVKLYKNNTLLWESMVPGNNITGVSFPAMTIPVNAGDALYFSVKQEGTLSYDAVVWDPVIEYKTLRTYQASVDFSTVQGQNGWYYVEKSPTGYVNMGWNAADNRWRGSSTWCIALKEWQHPDINDSARKWIAPYSGSVLITSNGNIRKLDTGGGDGVNVRLYKNNTLLWESRIAWNDGVGINFPARVVEVGVGDAIYFVVNKNGDINNDGTVWDPVIEYRTGTTYHYNPNNQLVETRQMGNPKLKFYYDNNGNLIRKQKL